MIIGVWVIHKQGIVASEFASLRVNMNLCNGKSLYKHPK